MPHTITSMALFCDFENIALGARDAKYAKFDIDRVLAHLEETAFSRHLHDAREGPDRMQ